MPKKSTIMALPPELLAEVEALWGTGRVTLDQMVARLRELGAEISRSALGRQTKKWDRRLAKIRDARELSRSWKAQMREDPESDVSQILGEHLAMMAFDVTDRLDDASEEGMGAKDLAQLAKMGRDLAQMRKLDADRIERMMKQAAEKARRDAVKAAEGVMKERGLSRETVDAIKARILGVQA